MLAILDYQAGNQTSVKRALDHAAIPSIITGSAEDLQKARGIIFPGVGAAGQAMGHLREKKLDIVLHDLIARNMPLLGICLGCQILFEKSEEYATQTLGILPGECLRFSPSLQEGARHLPVPHMGWNSLSIHQQSPLLRNLPTESQMYFVHSYYVQTPKDYLLASSHYGHDFCAIAGKDGLWGAQFHVEKSGEAGLLLLRNFYDYCCETAFQGS